MTLRHVIAIACRSPSLAGSAERSDYGGGVAEQVIVIVTRSDEAQFALTQAIQVRSERFSVFPVESTDAALRSVVAIQPAAVVLPYESRDVIRHIVDMKRLAPDAPVIVTSEHGIVPEVLQAGADAMIQESRSMIEEVVVKLDEMIPDDDAFLEE